MLVSIFNTSSYSAISSLCKAVSINFRSNEKSSHTVVSAASEEESDSLFMKAFIYFLLYHASAIFAGTERDDLLI